jgi:hypothetical protein
MLSKYLYIKALIKKKMATTSKPEFKKMLQTMDTRTTKYLDEALDCDAIIISTALNPSFRLSIFKMAFPRHYSYTLELLTNLFNTQKDSLVENESSKEPTQFEGNRPARHNQDLADIDYFPETSKASPPDELSIYLDGKYKLPSGEAENCLTWWKVRIFQSNFILKILIGHSLIFLLICRTTVKSSPSCLS